MPQNFESKFTVMPPSANVEARAQLQQQRDLERQDRIAELAMRQQTDVPIFDNTPYICGDICPMENVKSKMLFDRRDNFIDGALSQKEMEDGPAALLIASCVDMQNCGECLYFQE